MATWFVKTASDLPTLTVEADALWFTEDTRIWRLVDAKGNTVAAFPAHGIVAVWKDQNPQVVEWNYTHPLRIENAYG